MTFYVFCTWWVLLSLGYFLIGCVVGGIWYLLGAGEDDAILFLRAWPLVLVIGAIMGISWVLLMVMHGVFRFVINPLRRIWS